MNFKKNSGKSTNNMGIPSEDFKMYEVERIIDMKKFGKQIKYLVHWKGYSESDSTWEKRENLTNISFMLEEFELKQRENMEVKGLNKKKSKTNVKTEIEVNGELDKNTPAKILKIIKHQSEILCLIDWKRDKNGVKPLPSLYNKTEIEEKAPLLLIRYYEARIVFYNPESK